MQRNLWNFLWGTDSDTVIVLLEEKTSDAVTQAEIIPTTAEVKENVARAICRAAKNGN